MEKRNDYLIKALEKARKEFLPFVRAMWPSFIHGRHHETMAEAFERGADLT